MCPSHPPEPSSFDISGLVVAARDGDVAAVRDALAKYPRLANAQSMGTHVLCKAAYEGHLEVVRLLVEHGADLHAVDSLGNSATKNAGLMGHRDVYNLLVAAGAPHDLMGLYALNMRAEEEAKRQAEVAATEARPPAKTGGCFIATACYGSYDHPDVMLLRRFRDRHLARSQIGRRCISLYYALSPPVAKLLAGSALSSLVRRLMLEPLVRKLR